MGCTMWFRPRLRSARLRCWKWSVPPRGRCSSRMVSSRDLRGAMSPGRLKLTWLRCWQIAAEYWWDTVVHDYPVANQRNGPSKATCTSGVELRSMLSKLWKYRSGKVSLALSPIVSVCNRDYSSWKSESRQWLPGSSVPPWADWDWYKFLIRKTQRAIKQTNQTRIFIQPFTLIVCDVESENWIRRDATAAGTRVGGSANMMWCRSCNLRCCSVDTSYETQSRMSFFKCAPCGCCLVRWAVNRHLRMDGFEEASI